jgi:hypothetical protein
MHRGNLPDAVNVEKNNVVINEVLLVEETPKVDIEEK